MVPHLSVATQHWFCRSLQWFCDGGSSDRVNGHDVPEIHAAAFGLLMALVLFGTALILDYWRTKR